MKYLIKNRRYTGCKSKLLDWIKKTISNNCLNCNSFFDIFAGTGVVTNEFIGKYNELIINDFLYSNEMIYQGFFLNKKYDIKKMLKYKNLFNEKNLYNEKDNYFSENFGNKYFSLIDAKIIGNIRERIEKDKVLKLINQKEYAILIASLIYSIDKIANTCGHYEAFFKKKKIEDKFIFELIEPIDFSKYKNLKIKIYRKDANEIAKRIKADIVYIDPPYSSRQYSRFYHLLETLVKWDKEKLFGVAKKPKAENMSVYCSSKAKKYFKDLIDNLNCKYIVVSYNNTYNSKSKSSANKMMLEDIEEILKNRGQIKIYSKKYKAFNAGKTDLNNHKEYLFILKVV